MKTANLFAPSVLCVLLAGPHAVAQDQAWIRQLGTSYREFLSAAAPDGAGGVFVGGATEGHLAGTNPDPGRPDVWLARYDGTGNQVFIQQFGLPLNDDLNAAASDGAGGVYVSGLTYGSLGGPNAGVADVWLARYDGSGNRLWILQFGTATGESGRCAATDGAGGVFVGGSTSGNLGGPKQGGSDAWLTRYDGSGNRLWIRQFGSSSNDFLYLAAADGAGGVFIGGITEGSLAAPNAGYSDVWLAHYDGAGNQLAILQVGTSDSDDVSALAPAPFGGVFAAGVLGVSSANGSFLWRLDGTLAPVWSIADLGWFVWKAAPDGPDKLYLVGRDATGYVLASHDSDGNELWRRQVDFGASAEIGAAAQGEYGGVYVGGWLPRGGGLYDAWLARYALAPATYCTAKPGLVCGTPAISSSGIPSCTASNGFQVIAAPAQSGKSGVILYSGAGRTSLPFAGGTLCVKPPLRRGPAVGSGGFGPCLGAFVLDMNAFASGNAGGNPAAWLVSPGTVVNVQWWGRDSVATGSFLSDALEYVVGP